MSRDVLGEGGALLLLALRLGIGTDFVLVGGTKVFRLRQFREAIGNYSVIPDGLVWLTATFVAAAELLAGALLLVGIATSEAAAVIAVLLVAFAGVITINLRRGRSFDCGCRGAVPSIISWKHVVVNVLLAVCAVVVGLAPAGSTTILQWPSGVIVINVPAGSILPVTLAAVAVMLMTRVIRAADDLRRVAHGD